MAYDTQAATEAGHSIDDQLAYLAKLHNYDIKAAEEAGHSKENQLSYLAGLDEPSQSIGDKISGVLGVDDMISAPAVGTALGAATGSALGSQVGGATDAVLEYLAKKIAPTAVSEAELGAPKGVTSWLKQETGHPYAGGKTKEEAYLKSEIARGKPVKSRGSEVPIRKGRLGITNQLEVQEPTLAKKAATNIIEGERLGKPGMARRMLGMGVAGGELGNVKEELEKGNYGRAALSGLGALGGVASQSKIKPIRAIGTALSAGVPALQYFLPDTQEDTSNINKNAGGSVQNFAPGGAVLKKAAPQVAEGAKKYSDIIQNYIGKVLHPTIVDTTKVDLPLGKMGGPEASNLQNISPLHKAEDWVFANDSMAAAKRLHNVSQRNDGNAIITGLLGSPTQLKTNRSVFGDLTDEFYKAIAAGKLDPELLQKYQDAMKASTYKTNKGMMTTFPEQFDIRDRAALEENAKLFHQRAALADIMGGKGPTGVQLGGKKGQIFNWEDVLGAARDPNTIGAPTQSIGTRLFTLNERAPEYRPDLHNAFDYALFGKDLGHSFAPVPKEVGYPDAIEAIRQGNIAKGKKPDVTSMHLSRNILTQPITEDYVKAVQASGYAPGGKVMKSAVEEFKKKFTPGFYHGSPSPSIKVFDPSKSKKSEEFITPGITFVTPKPQFAESFLNPGSKPYYSLQSGELVPQKSFKTGSTMYPVSVNLGKHFDPSTPEGEQIVKDYLAKRYAKEAATPDFDEIISKKHEHMMDKLMDPINNWRTLESPSLIQHLKDTGHDTFSVTEGGIKNVGVFEPQNIRGKFAKYNPEEAANPDFMKAEGGAVEGYAPGGKVVSALETLAKKVMPLVEREANKAKFLEGSAIKDRVYHGTGADIKEFKPSRIGAMGPGHYVSLNPETASEYTGIIRPDKESYPNVLPLHVSVKNPFVISDINKSHEEFFRHFDPTGTKLSDAEVIQKAKEAGYDAIHALKTGDINVFEPTQLKSATGNIGTYNPLDPDITKKRGGKIKKKKK